MSKKNKNIKSFEIPTPIELEELYNFLSEKFNKILSDDNLRKKLKEFDLSIHKGKLKKICETNYI